MANTSARMLRLLSLLQTHRYWPGAELADRLEVSPRTLRRDVDRLRDLGYPVDAARGVAGGYQLQAGAAMPPLLLDDEEAVAIALGLRTAAAGAVAGFEETSVRALAKVIQLLPPRLRRRIDALREVTSPGGFGTGPTLDPATLTTLALACRGEERLRFTYTPPATAGQERAPSMTRHVEPHRLVSLGRRWYLIAWDLDRADWRSFRVDRLSSPRPTGARFRPREIPGGDPVAWVRKGFTAAPARYDVSVLIGANAATVRAFVGHWGHIEELSDDIAPVEIAPGAAARGPAAPGAAVPGDAALGDARRNDAVANGAARGGPGWCRMRMNVDDLGWPVMVLGVLAAEFTIESPPELRDRVREAGETLLRGAG